MFLPCALNPAPVPIIDLRGRHSWLRRLPARAATLGLWGTALALVGPVLITPVLAKAAMGVGVSGLVGGPLVRRLGPRLRRRPAADRQATPEEANPPEADTADPSRHRLAQEFGMSEVLLFRARHGQVCTLHHDGEGRIVAIDLPEADRTSACTDRDAHPVG